MKFVTYFERSFPLFFSQVKHPMWNLFWSEITDYSSLILFYLQKIRQTGHFYLQKMGQTGHPSNVLYFFNEIFNLDCLGQNFGIKKVKPFNSLGLCTSYVWPTLLLARSNFTDPWYQIWSVFLFEKCDIRVNVICVFNFLRLTHRQVIYYKVTELGLRICTKILTHRSTSRHTRYKNSNHHFQFSLHNINDPET